MSAKLQSILAEEVDKDHLTPYCGADLIRLWAMQTPQCQSNGEFDVKHYNQLCRDVGNELGGMTGLRLTKIGYRISAAVDEVEWEEFVLITTGCLDAEIHDGKTSC